MLELRAQLEHQQAPPMQPVKNKKGNDFKLKLHPHHTASTIEKNLPYSIARDKSIWEKWQNILCEPVKTMPSIIESRRQS